MNRLYPTVSFIIFSFFMLGVFVVHAEDATSTATTSGSILNTVIDNVTNIKDTIEHKTTDSTEGNGVLKQTTQKRVVNLAANISNRFDAIIWRFENISSRLQKRIEAEKAAGHNVDAAQTSLNNANTAIADAKHDMDGIDGAVYDAVTSKDPKNEWTQVKAKYLHARTSIKTAYQELKNTITNLKSPAAPTPVTSSSTPAN